MNTRLTLADVREALYAEVNPDNPNDPLFLSWLNQACERFTWSGKWKGALVHTVFASSAGFITLPPDFYGILAMRYDRWSGSPVFSQYRQYMELGPGEVDDTASWPGFLFDMGDGFVTYLDIPAGTVTNLRITLENAADTGKSFRFFGVNGGAHDIKDPATGVIGLPFTSVFPFNDTSSTTSVLFANVTGIQAPSNLVGSWTLSYIDGSTIVPMGYYQPWETRPMYRRYQTGVAEDAIKVLCQRRFMPIRSETDWVIPGNLGALTYGLKMMYQEQRQEYEKAEAAFQKGLDLLNQEAKSSRGGVRADILINPFGDGIAFPWTA